MAHRIVVVGGGASGLELATRLGRTLGKKRLEGKPIADYQYKDYGPLISRAKYSAVGNLMGSLLEKLQHYSPTLRFIFNRPQQDQIATQFERGEIDLLIDDARLSARVAKPPTRDQGC